MISVRNIGKKYVQSDGGTFTAISGINLEIQKGEFVVIFGPNGAGKSTLLNIVAGLDQQFSGSVKIGGNSPKDSKIGLVFQNYNEALFPWKNVIDNVSYPLIIGGVAKDEADKKSLALLSKVNLQNKKDDFVYNLSGGQRQLISICRAFVNEPDFLILDEPCSSLDYATTKKVEMEIQELWMQSEIPALCVSHDIDEAVFLADRVVILSAAPGRIKEIIDIDLPRPRNLKTFTSKDFFEYRSKVLKSFLHA